MLQAYAQAVDLKVDHHFGEGQGKAVKIFEQAAAARPST